MVCAAADILSKTLCCLLKIYYLSKYFFFILDICICYIVLSMICEYCLHTRHTHTANAQMKYSTCMLAVRCQRSVFLFNLLTFITLNIKSGDRVRWINLFYEVLIWPLCQNTNCLQVHPSF